MATTFTFSELEHAYRDGDGRLVPSVTQRLKAGGMISFDGINPQVLERKRQLGTLVHKVTELYDRGESLDDFEIPPAVMEYVDGYLNFRHDCGFTPTIIESRMLGECYGMSYGMQPDRVGNINGEPHVVELKCGAAQHPVWGVQLAAYSMGLHNGRPNVIARAAVQLGPQFPRGYKIHPYPDKTEYQVWASVLAITTWSQNKGILQVEDIPERIEAV